MVEASRALTGSSSAQQPGFPNCTPHRSPADHRLILDFENPAATSRQQDRKRHLKTWVRRGRQAARAAASTWLARLRGTREPCGAPLAKPPETILVCRVNRRLGNMLFVTPLIRSLAGAFPEASIHVLVRDPAHGPLLAGLPGVSEIIHVPRTFYGCLALVRQIRKRSYDLAIDPSINAASNRIAISLCHARYKLGFAGREQWVRLTHAAAIPGDEPHQARQAVRLLHEGIPGLDRQPFDRLAVHPGDAATARAEEILTGLLGNPVPGPVVGFFTKATGNKQLPPEWWRDWAEAVRSGPNAPLLLQILPPGSDAPLLRETPCASFSELDRLAALLGLLDVFVAADSGPMHLAAAAGTPTIGLFRVTSPENYAPLGRHCIALGPQDLAPDRAAEYALRRLGKTRDRLGSAHREWGEPGSQESSARDPVLHCWIMSPMKRSHSAS